MLNKNEIEIFNQAHIMQAEGAHENYQYYTDIEETLTSMGYKATNIKSFHDNMQDLFRWTADISKI